MKPSEIQIVVTCNSGALNTKEAAEFCRMSKGTFDELLSQGSGPTPIRCNAKTKSYLPQELIRWMAELTENSRVK